MRGQTNASNSLVYMPGDTIVFEGNALMGTGYVNFSQIPQVLIPLMKPISPSVTSITINNNPTVRCNGNWSDIQSPALSKHPLGIYIRGSTTLTGQAEQACAVRANSAGSTITFN